MLKKGFARRTRRLVIRPLARADYPAWREASLGLLPARNAFDRGPRAPELLTRAKFSEVLESQRKHRENDKYYDLAVFRRDTGELIGQVSAMDVLRGLAQSAFLGYSLFNHHWGQGFGKEAVSAMIDIAFRELELHRIEAGIEPTNRRSIFLARSIGLRKEGLKKRAVFLRGKWVDLVMYSATCEEFGIRWKGNATTRAR